MSNTEYAREMIARNFQSAGGTDIPVGTDLAPMLRQATNKDQAAHCRVFKDKKTKEVYVRQTPEFFDALRTQWSSDRDKLIETEQKLNEMTSRCETAEKALEQLSGLKKVTPDKAWTEA